MQSAVMRARKKLNVAYPNLYAVPGVHEKADAFNRVQRGHQNYLENVNEFRTLALIGGLKHPYAVAIGGILFSLGSYLYLLGYSDMSLDVKMARYKKGAGIKWIGLLTALYSTISFTGSLLSWW